MRLAAGLHKPPARQRFPLLGSPLADIRRTDYSNRPLRRRGDTGRRACGNPLTRGSSVEWLVVCIRENWVKFEVFYLLLIIDDARRPEMNQFYYDAVTKMEQLGVDDEYIQGWQCGFLQNPKREEQRLTEAYEAGYTDGEGKNTDNFGEWVKN